MQDIINSFKAHLYDRTSNPLVGSFIFYWLVCNYKLLVVLFDGDLNSGEKFDLIKKLYPQDVLTLWNGFDIYYYTLLGNGLLIPLVITLIYIFFVPIPAKYIYEYWFEKQQEIQKIKRDKEKQELLTVEQSNQLKEDFYNLELKYYELLKTKNFSTNEEVNLSENRSPSKKELKMKTSDTILDSLELDILKIIAESDISTEGIQDKLNHNYKKIVVEHCLDMLIDNKYIDTYENDYGHDIYFLSKKGRKYLVENNLI